MGPSETSRLKKTRFTEFLIRENGLDQNGFAGWVFHPSMLLRAHEKWWGDRTARDRLHEGLDFCSYRDGRGTLVHLRGSTRITVMYDGVVVQIMDDFLGKSIVVEHRPVNRKNPLLTVYGHVVPDQDLPVGRILKEGDVIGTLADRRTSRGGVSPHLHISLFQASTTLSYEALNWKSIHTLGLEIIDPLDVLDGKYFIV
jgi:murein DD-endopeptidase MepM/ murein hydrolase activator NlpD